jgi:hypothetical protein
MSYPCIQAGYTFKAAYTLQAEYNGRGLQSVSWVVGEHFDTAADLVEDVAVKCQAACGGAWGSSIHSSGIATGKVTIWVSANVLRILWGTDHTLRDWLGFGTDLTPAGSLFVGTNAHTGGWYPDDSYAWYDDRERVQRPRALSRTDSLVDVTTSGSDIRPVDVTLRVPTLALQSGDASPWYDLVGVIAEVVNGETWGHCPDRSDQATRDLYVLSPEWDTLIMRQVDQQKPDLWMCDLQAWRAD